MGKREKLKKRFCAKLRRNFFGLLLAKVCFLETRGFANPTKLQRLTCNLIHMLQTRFVNLFMRNFKS